MGFQILLLSPVLSRNKANIGQIYRRFHPISSEATLMGSNNVELFNQAVSTNNFSLAINTDKKEEADR